VRGRGRVDAPQRRLEEPGDARVVVEYARIVVPVVAGPVRGALEVHAHEVVAASEVVAVEPEAVGVGRRVEHADGVEVGVALGVAQAPQLAAHDLGGDPEDRGHARRRRRRDVVVADRRERELVAAQRQRRRRDGEGRGRRRAALGVGEPRRGADGREERVPVEPVAYRAAARPLVGVGHGQAAAPRLGEVFEGVGAVAEAVPVAPEDGEGAQDEEGDDQAQGDGGEVEAARSGGHRRRRSVGEDSRGDMGGACEARAPGAIAPRLCFASKVLHFGEPAPRFEPLTRRAWNRPG
jgi:hypothetical protein